MWKKQGKQNPSPSPQTPEKQPQSPNKNPDTERTGPGTGAGRGNDLPSKSNPQHDTRTVEGRNAGETQGAGQDQNAGETTQSENPEA